MDHPLRMPRHSPVIVLLPRQRAILERLIRSSTAEHRIVERSKIVVTAADGDLAIDQAEALNIDRQRVRRWRTRFAEALDLLNAAELQPVSDADLEHLIVDILRDGYRAGTKPTFTPEQIAQIISLACEEPEKLGLPVTHWTPTELGREAVSRKIVDEISPRHIARFFGGGRDSPAPFPVLAQPENHRPGGTRTRGAGGVRGLSRGHQARG